MRSITPYKAWSLALIVQNLLGRKIINKIICQISQCRKKMPRVLTGKKKINVSNEGS